jgi:LysR family glycine cleavage system transcriptional activator
MLMARELLPPLIALRAFEAVARNSSFKAAAVELSVTPTAISHHVRHLEQYIGERLLDRTPRTCRLTSAGEILFEATTSGFSDIRQAVGRLRRKRKGSTLTISATPAFLSLWLVPRMQALRKHCPDLDLRLHASKTVTSLREDGIDVAIRYGDVAIGSADSFVLLRDEFTPLCSPRLGIRRLGDLRRATLLHVDGYRAPRPAPTWARWCRQVGIEEIDTEMGPRFSDSLHATQAAMGGQGVVLGSPVIVSDALSLGVLVRPFRQAVPGAAYCFVCSPTVATRTDVKALRAWLQASMGAPA